MRTKRGFTPTPKNLVRGFTLIELLIVIAIIAILAIIIVIAINPARILEKSRDSQRFSDMTTLATAVNLYLADNHDFALMVGPYKSTDGLNDNARKKNDGTGWIPIDFAVVSSGAPLAALPLDPTNNAAHHYVFGVNVGAKTYEVDCVFENSTGDNPNTDKHGKDGGNSNGLYEVGTDLTILNDASY